MCDDGLSVRNVIGLSCQGVPNGKGLDSKTVRFSRAKLEVKLLKPLEVDWKSSVLRHMQVQLLSLALRVLTSN